LYKSKPGISPGFFYTFILHKNKAMKKHTIYLVFAFLFSVITFAQNPAKRISDFNLTNKVAIQGYDPVAYFKQGKPVKGTKQLAASYQGVTYYFASEANKAAFLKKPQAYEPQYGGWCAFSMGFNGDKVKVDPKTFKIVDGKLFLFYNELFNNTLKSWNKDEGHLKKKADANWKKIIK
jgi:YHS domain-containing protein